MDVPYCSDRDWLSLTDGSCGCSHATIQTDKGTYGKCNLADNTSGRVFCYVNTKYQNGPCCQDKTSGGYCINYDLCDSTTAKGGF